MCIRTNVPTVTEDNNETNRKEIDFDFIWTVIWTVIFQIQIGY